MKIFKIGAIFQKGISGWDDSRAKGGRIPPVPNISEAPVGGTRIGRRWNAFLPSATPLMRVRIGKAILNLISCTRHRWRDA